MNKNIINISVDPGYDAYKVVINGMILRVPNEQEQISNTNTDFNNLGEETEDYILSEVIENKKYLVGNMAVALLKDDSSAIKNKLNSIQNDYDLSNRFTSEKFEVGLLSVIGFALCKYSKAKKEQTVKFDIDDYYRVYKYNNLNDNDEEKTALKSNKGFMEMVEYYQNTVIKIGVSLPFDIKSTAKWIENFYIEQSK